MESKFRKHLLNNLFKIALYICTLSIISCSAQNKQSNQNIPNFIKIVSQSHGGLLKEQYIVITNNKQLKGIYTQINLTRKPGLPLPSIDFEKEVVIALFLGQRNSGGYSINIDSIHVKKNTSFEVVIKETIPTDMVSLAITQPFSIYKLDLPNHNITFIKGK